MLLVAPIASKRRKTLPENYNSLPLFERLYTSRSDLQSITHIDFSARIQTVHRATNPRYYQLLESFKQKTGYSILVNTSFNVRGEPPVCTPTEAYACFMRTEMDYLVVGNYLLDKKEQPLWSEKENWQTTFAKD
jgi:carbamoyltransferase